MRRSRTRDIPLELAAPPNLLEQRKRVLSGGSPQTVLYVLTKITSRGGGPSFGCYRRTSWENKGPEYYQNGEFALTRRLL